MSKLSYVETYAGITAETVRRALQTHALGDVNVPKFSYSLGLCPDGVEFLARVPVSIPVLGHAEGFNPHQRIWRTYVPSFVANGYGYQIWKDPHKVLHLSRFEGRHGANSCVTTEIKGGSPNTFRVLVPDCIFVLRRKGGGKWDVTAHPEKSVGGWDQVHLGRFFEPNVVLRKSKAIEGLSRQGWTYTSRFEPTGKGWGEGWFEGKDHRRVMLQLQIASLESTYEFACAHPPEGDPPTNILGHPQSMEEYRVEVAELHRRLDEVRQELHQHLTMH